MMVVSRRNRRKRRHAELEEDNDEDYLLPASNGALRKEAAGPVRLRTPPEKQQGSLVEHPRFEDIILPELLPTIMSFLDDSEDVYKLSKCSKYIRKAITPEIVIRSAVFAGGMAQDVLTHLMELVKDGKIYTPSIFRILRLVNAKSCERGERCCGYNLVTKQAELLGNESCRPFGLAVCLHCVNAVSINTSRNSFSAKERELFAWYSHGRLLCQPQIEVATGHSTGSILLAQEAQQINVTYDSPEERVDALKSLRTDLLGVNQRSEERREKLVEIFLKAKSEYPDFVAARKRIVHEKQQAKQQARASRKKENVAVVYKKIDHLLDGYKYKEHILKGHYNQEGVFLLRYGPSRVILEPVLLAPTKATRKILAKAVEDVKTVFDMLETESFMGSGTLLWNYGHAENEIEKAFVQYCRRHVIRGHLLTKGYFTPYENLWWSRHRPNYTAFNDFLRSGKPVHALFAILDHKRKVDFVTQYLVTLNEGNCSLIPRCKRVLMAERFRPYPGVENFGSFCSSLASRSVQYKRLCQNCVDYLNHPRTKKFLSKTDLPPGRQHIPFFQFTRRDAVNSMYLLDPRQTLALLDRRFATLRAYHRFSFMQGRKFGPNDYHRFNQ